MEYYTDIDSDTRKVWTEKETEKGIKIIYHYEDRQDWGEWLRASEDFVTYSYPKKKVERS